MISTLFITIQAIYMILSDMISIIPLVSPQSPPFPDLWPLGGLCPALGLAEVMRAAQQIGWEAAWKASAWRRTWAQIYDPKLGLECLERLRMVLFKLNSDG